MMSLLAVKLTPVYLSLFVILVRCGWAQDITNKSQVEVGHVTSGGSSFPPTIAIGTSPQTPVYIRRRRASANVKKSSCMTPAQPVNGEYKLDRYYCDDITDCAVSEGTALEPGSQLVYRCNPGYEAKGNTDVYCRSRGKWSPIPECVEVKCDSLNSESTMATCTRFNKWANCDSPVPPETRAEVACRRGYKKDTDFITSRSAVVDCNINGKWEPQPIRCVPVCGSAITHQQPLVYGGTPARIGDFPWHASLFREKRSSTGNEKVFLCGGTIIQTNLVLTAAHCVYDERTKTTEDPAKLFVITGNIFRDYDSPAHNPEIVRKASVKKVYAFCNYYGLTGNYVSDIALLELQQPLEFSSILLPACLDDSGYSDQFLEPGLYGKVAGFGRTATGDTSGILQTLAVPYISYSQCRVSNNAAQNEAFISSDKFCAGYNNGSAVCEGDSGGGLVFKKGDLWYVMGIVSVGLGVDLDNGEKTCDKYSYSLYTKVSTYMPWIKEVLFYVERNQPYPSCRQDSRTSMAAPTVPSRPSTASSVILTVPTSDVAQSSCLAPPQPANGEWKLHRNFCKGDVDCSVSEGTALEVGSQLLYSCTPDFTTIGPTDVYCQTGGQWSSIPSCRGAPCHSENGGRGVCTLLKNCQPVLDELKVGKSPDNACGFSGLEPVVCCQMTETSPPLDAVDLVGDGRGAIAKQKCIEYSRYVNASKCPPPVVDNEQPMNAAGETEVNRMEFPHMAAVGFLAGEGKEEAMKDPNGSDMVYWYCAGTLISETFVLTTASCGDTRANGDPAWVRVGDLSLEKSNGGAMPEERRVTERIPHPEYNSRLTYHDIALLRLESPVLFNSWIRPACLHTAPSVGTEGAIATEFGDSYRFSASSVLYLVKEVLPFVDLPTCQAERDLITTDRELSNGIIGDLFICAVARRNDSCQPDFGGPLVIRRVGSDKELCNMYDVIGVTAFKKPCGFGIPELYTRIYNYVPWIESIVWGHG